MTLADMAKFLELADAQGVDSNSEVKVVVNGQPGVYDITGWNVTSSITRTPTLGITRQPTAQTQE